MIGYLIDVQNDKAEVVETTCQLEDYYNKLKCRTIDIVTRKVGGKYYDIVADDEGMFAEDVRISAINPEGENMLVGNLLVLNCPDKHDEEGNECGLEDEDVKRIAANVRRLGFRSGRTGYVLICEY